MRSVHWGPNRPKPQRFPRTWGRRSLFAKGDIFFSEAPNVSALSEEVLIGRKHAVHASIIAARTPATGVHRPDARPRAESGGRYPTHPPLSPSDQAHYRCGPRLPVCAGESGNLRDVSEEARLAPSLFHRWQEQLFGNAALALEGNRRAERGQDQQRIEKLEQKIRQKDEVLAELMAEHISLKKELGGL